MWFKRKQILSSVHFAHLSVWVLLTTNTWLSHQQRNITYDDGCFVIKSQWHQNLKKKSFSPLMVVLGPGILNNPRLRDLVQARRGGPLQVSKTGRTKIKNDNNEKYTNKTNKQRLECFDSTAWNRYYSIVPSVVSWHYTCPKHTIPNGID